MIRVLHVVPSLALGGTEAFIMNIYRNIDRSKIQFDFLVLNENDYPYTEEINELGGNIYFGIYPHYKNLREFISKCVEIMDKGKYNIVHSHVNIMNAWAILAAKISGIPIRISHSHDMYGKEGSFIYRTIHCLESILIKIFSNRFFACSIGAGEYLYGKNFFRKRGVVINNGIDVEKFIYSKDKNSDTLKKELGIPDKASYVFGNITRFENKKNQLFILKIFKKFLEHEPDAFLILGGPDGGLLTECKLFVESNNLTNSVRFIGSRKDVSDVLNTIDVYLFPSLYEGLGIVLLEAQAAKCIVIASDACPIESDMGLGLIEYIPLSETISFWTEAIRKKLKEYDKTSISNYAVTSAFSKKMYNVEQLAKQMSSIYLDGVK